MSDRDDVDFDLRSIDDSILDLLDQGWRTRKYLADELDVTAEYIGQRIDLLIKLGIVERVHDGFYRLADETESDDRDADPVAELDLDESKADAVRAMYEFVQEEGETTPAALKDEVFPEHPATYEGSGPDYWHRQLAEPLAALPGIERPSQRRWVYSNG